LTARIPLDAGLLIALCAVLPLLEAPKHLLWLAYLAAWLVNRIRARDFGGPWDTWDTLIAAWIGSGLLVAIFAALPRGEWRGFGDLLHYTTLLWTLKRARYPARHVVLALAALVASTVAGLLYSHYQLWITREINYPDLHSVGHQNHSAIYLAIVLGLALAWLFCRWRAWSAAARIGWILILSLMVVSLVLMASRAAFAVALVLMVALAAAFWPRWRMPLFGMLMAVAVIGVAAVFGGGELMKKHERNLLGGVVFAFRDVIWDKSLETLRRYPWFGVGMDNFGMIGWKDAEDAKRIPHGFPPHGHSLIFNTLAERGIVGSAALAAVLLAWFLSLVRARPRPEDDDLDWLLWCGAFSAWFVTVGVGVLNTTLHNEHGMLSTLLLGLWLARRNARRRS
jgi:O-antigen ligase